MIFEKWTGNAGALFLRSFFMEFIPLFIGLYRTNTLIMGVEVFTVGTLWFYLWEIIVLFIGIIVLYLGIYRTVY